ncbi:MAG: ATP-binding cassette domain-containing protein [Bacteroidaceae bacterium]|nr:ATP-binding cassette domain-containing protein [Bacteroidaceae bacterium]
MIEVKDFSIGFFKRELMGPDSEPEWLTLKNLYLQIRPGHVYGLIGRNGQGKTTLLNCITGLLRPKKKEAGVVYIDGFPVNASNPNILSKFFYVTDTIASLHLRSDIYADTLFHFYPHFNKEKFTECMELFQIDTKQFIDEISLGQRKMTFLSYAFASGVPYLIMDEPTNGLDITSRSVFRKLVASYMDQDKAIVISTHHINEISTLLDHIFILNDKHIVFDHSVMETGCALSFVESDNMTDDALYSMSSAYGKRIILPNTNNSDSEIDYELLFEAVLENPTLINAQFTTLN